jgi:5-methylcytosine-specific restriction endonuclease McrBC regulatory subunit McrC
MLKSFTIRESKTEELDLSFEQALQLQAIGEELARNAPKDMLDADDETEDEARQIVTCTRTLDGKTRVFVSGAVGAIQLDGAFIEVQPKIGLTHFIHLAKYYFEVPRSSTLDALLDTDPTFWEVVAHWAVDETSKALRGGLVSDYVERREDLTYVRGKLHMVPTLRNLHAGKLRIDSSFDELDTDHPLNRVLKAAMRMAATSPRLRGSLVQIRAAQLERQLADVGSLQKQDLGINTDRRTRRFAAALELCKRMLTLNGVNLKRGTASGRTFLIPTAALAEGAIRTIIANALGDPLLRNSPKPLRVEGNRYFTVNPDLHYPELGATGDVKYKIAEADWNRPDIAQALMFSNAYDTSKAFIATFAREGDLFSDESLHFPDRTIRRILWRFGPDQRPDASEANFTERVCSFLGVAVQIGAVE